MPSLHIGEFEAALLTLALQGRRHRAVFFAINFSPGKGKAILGPIRTGNFVEPRIRSSPDRARPALND
jgi:hypothetical protein